jgi:glycosyltransferase involved in cell wall biosynthesis
VVNVNILFFAPNYYPHIGGVEKHIYELSNTLVKDGHNITVLTIKHDNTYADFEEIHGVTVIRINRQKNRYKNRLYIYLKLFRNIGKFLKSDVVHFHDYGSFWYYGIILYPILKLFRINMYITFHGWEGVFPPMKSIVTRRKLAAKLMRGNICIGHYIEKWYSTKATIVSYGGVTECEKTVEDINSNYVVFIGRLEHDTGILEYIEAWKQSSHLYTKLSFVICGDGSLKNYIENLIKDEGIQDIEIRGLVVNPEDYIIKSKAVFTSGYLGILESFSLGKAVISTYNNEMKKDYLQMIPNSEDIMWIAKDSEEIVECLYEALIDNSKIEKAKKYAIENSWEKVRNDYYKLWGLNI